MWRRWIDTGLDSPHDIVQWHTAPSIPGHTYLAEARSVAVLYVHVKSGKNPPLSAGKEMRGNAIQKQAQRFDDDQV